MTNTLLNTNILSALEQELCLLSSLDFFWAFQALCLLYNKDLNFHLYCICIFLMVLVLYLYFQALPMAGI